MKALSPLALIAGVSLLAPAASQADATPQCQSVAVGGDIVGDARIQPNGWFEVGALNDNGQISFVRRAVARAGC